MLLLRFGLSLEECGATRRERGRRADGRRGLGEWGRDTDRQTDRLRSQPCKDLGKECFREMSGLFEGSQELRK